MSDLLNIEVAYALPERQTVLCIRVAPETSVLAAIEQSGILQKHPEIDLSVNKFGIYSRPVKGTESVQEGIASKSTALSSPIPRRCARSGGKSQGRGRADVVTGGRPDVHRKRDDAGT